MALCRFCLCDNLTVHKLELFVMRFAVGEEVGIANPFGVEHRQSSTGVPDFRASRRISASRMNPERGAGQD
jgi:hypothetical protein